MNSTEFKIHNSSKIYGTSVIGKDTVILENVILGYPEHKILMEILKQNIEIEDFRVLRLFHRPEFDYKGRINDIFQRKNRKKLQNRT